MTAPPLNVGSSRCRCVVCGESFGGPTAFDKHQTLSGPRAAPTLTCRPPATVGLRLTGQGHWSQESPKFADGVGPRRANAPEDD